ncbi:hypothetical protein SK803_09365 [Lentzea sp. BCCO 10_0856]|uniref:Uncharacterized protein n=1 Tax=Lentzea miocenica TaxID=3095431 RepID=A0ABU4SX17_9PSEU|nr:hypothetical protein [Lentzea sp. BCCO 10_0856]MDX8030418.1 hypothetical protein [Lentzea sp. BCCO 10_0856]
MGAHGHLPGRALLGLQALAGNRAVQRAVTEGKFNIVGENHDKTNRWETFEKDFAKSKGLDYWRENKFKHGGKRGDHPVLIALQMVSFLGDHATVSRARLTTVTQSLSDPATDATVLRARLGALLNALPSVPVAMSLYKVCQRKGMPKVVVQDCLPLVRLTNVVHALRPRLVAGSGLAEALHEVDGMLAGLISEAESIIRANGFGSDLLAEGHDAWRPVIAQISWQRAGYMLNRANKAAAAGVRGIWKVGDDHVTEMGAMALDPGPDVEITGRKEFSRQLKEWRRRSVS